MGKLRNVWRGTKEAITAIPDNASWVAGRTRGGVMAGLESAADSVGELANTTLHMGSSAADLMERAARTREEALELQQRAERAAAEAAAAERELKSEITEARQRRDDLRQSLQREAQDRRKKSKERRQRRTRDADADLCADDFGLQERQDGGRPSRVRHGRRGM